MKSKERPYVLFVAEKIYLKICEIKKKNLNISNIDAIESFVGSETYKEISSGKFHDAWFNYLEDNQFIDKKSGEKIPDETMKLLRIQKDITTKQLIKNSELYYAKSSFPLEDSQSTFNFLWRMCESYELWSKETQQPEQLPLNIID